MVDPDRRWVQGLLIGLLVLWTAFLYGRYGATPFIWWSVVAALPEEWVKRRWPSARIWLPLMETWGYGDSLPVAVLRFAMHNVWAFMPYKIGVWMHVLHNVTVVPSALSIILPWYAGYCAAPVVASMGTQFHAALLSKNVTYVRSAIDGSMLTTAVLECTRPLRRFDEAAYEEWAARVAPQMRADARMTWQSANYSSILGVPTGLVGGVDMMPLSALHALGLGLDLRWTADGFVDSQGVVYAADGLPVQTARTLPTLECICGGQFASKAARRDDAWLEVRDRECRKRPTLYLVGGFLSPTELPCAFTPCGCGASLEVAFTRYLASDPTVDPEAYKSLIRSEWYEAARASVRRVFVTATQFEDHLQGQKRADYRRSLAQAAPIRTTMTMMVKADEKVFSLAKPPRPLVFNDPAQLAQTGPMAYAVEQEVWQAWDYLFTKWAGRADAIATTILEMRETVSYYPHVYTLEVDISAADASSSKWSRDLYDHATALTGATVRNAEQVLGGWWEEAYAFSYLSAEWVAREGREIAHGGVAKYGKKLVGKFGLGPGQLATGKSRTNLQQTTMLGHIARGVLEDVLGPMKSWLEKHTDRVYASVKTGDDDLTFIGLTSEICVEEIASAMRCRWRNFGYDVKLSLREGFPTDMSMCSCYFYPAMKLGQPIDVPFQKLGRFFQRASTIAASQPRAKMEAIVAGMIKGYEAQAAWLTPVRLWCETMKAQIDQVVYAAAEMAPLEHVGKLLAPDDVTTSGQLDEFLGRLYNLSKDELIDMYADILKMRLGTLIRSPVATRVMEKDSE
jgi:hypothetical protein